MASIRSTADTKPDTGTGLSFLWLELTHKCNLECIHCYTSSSSCTPEGTVSTSKWKQLITEASDMGVGMIQLIGGEPTLHRDLEAIIDHASSCGLQVEVYSNLTSVTDAIWDCFVRNGVLLATSMYSCDGVAHDKITTRRGSHERTTSNIVAAHAKGLTVRAGIIEVSPGQDIDATQEYLANIGASDVRVDRARGVGRLSQCSDGDRESELCGNCTNGVAAIDPNGNVFPCIMSRWLPSGNVLESTLSDILKNGLAASRSHLDEKFTSRTTACAPQCSPTCSPINCSPRCNPMLPPCNPQSCQPLNQYCSPNYQGPSQPCTPRR